MEAKKEDQNDVPYRRRGRPTGKNRVPLSLEERRARNAMYERERRNETADAMAQLAEAVGCDANISNADLLATVISQIQRSTRNDSEQNIDDLIRINANLESQISMLQERLGLDDETYDQLENEGYVQSMTPHSSSETSASSYCTGEERSTRKQTKKRKIRSSSDTQEKRAKTKSETSTDSGVEMQHGSLSPTKSYDTDIQYLAPEQLQVPEEIIEENVSKTYVDLQAELYNQIYNSERQTSVQSIPDGADGSLSESCMASLIRSLIVVPSIVSPQEPPDLFKEQQTLSELSNVPIIESSCDNSNILNTDGECEILPRVEMTLDFLTDNERGLINDWLDCEFLETSAIK